MVVVARSGRFNVFGYSKKVLLFSTPHVTDRRNTSTSFQL